MKMNSKTRFVAIAAAATIAFAAQGETETVDGYTWTYRIVDGNAEIYNDGNCAVSPDLEITYYEVTPARVSNLCATEDGPGIILVSWNGFRVYDNGCSWTVQNDADGFKVYRATKSNFEESVLVAETESPYYCDNNVSVGSTNYYWVAATNQCGEGEISGPVIGYCEEPLVIETISLSDAMELVEYETQLSANGDADYLRWRIEEAYDKYGDPIVTLPEGFSVSEDGVVSGVALYAGEYAFTVSCRDRRFPDAAAEVKALVTLTVNENPNRKPVISGTTPVIGRDVVLEAGTSQRFDITASDPEDDNLTYKWFVDDEEVQSGANAYCLCTDSNRAGTNHVVTCYVNDDLWTNVVKCTWNVYVPKEIHIDPGSDDYAYALQSAIDDSTPYDTIHVPAGWYVECGVPHPLTIIADDGPTNTVIEGRVSLDEYSWRTPGRVTLRGFTLTGKIDSMSYESVYSNLSLERCIIESGGIDRDNWREDEYEETDKEETVRGLFVNCSLDRCTVANNCVDPEILPLMTNCVCSGTIVWGNEGAENDAQDPVFVSLSNGDYRLRASSPYVADGVVSRGALDDVVSGHVISASVVGPGSLDKMVATVEDGGSATFSVAVGSHPLDHFEVNGEPVVASGNSYNFPSVGSDATLTAFFVSNITFYVDVTNGNDAAAGFTKATAVATLQVAIDRAVNGDTILVSDGTYAPIDVADKRITIESENGYKGTIIDGGRTNGCVYAIYSIWATPSTNAVLRGFTLLNGYSYRGAGACGGTLERCLIVGHVAINEEPGYGAAYYYGQGGGAYGSMLRYCTIVNNTAEFWPGCEWEGNPQTSGGEGGGVYGCTLENCIVYDNEGEVAPDAFNTEYSSDSLVGEDPLFADAVNGDYRLISSSPCVVNGIATAGCETEVVEPKTLYVDAANGNDTADGLSKVNAVKTLQLAIDRAVNGDTILVADGTYAPISTDGKRIIIESENGYKTTVIDGGGTNRCIYAGGSSSYGDWANTNTVLRGFTLRNGNSFFGAGVVGGTLERCLISSNTVDADPNYAAWTVGWGGGAYGSLLRFCTVIGNRAYGWYGDENSIVGKGGGACDCILENCIVWGNSADVDADCSNCEATGCQIGEDPLFADYAKGDYRLISSSPYVANGVATAGCETEVVEPKTLYVDAANGNDTADGLSKASAVKTLQTAIDLALTGDTILVADGVYAPIGTRNRRIVIESENGYKNAIIDGGSTNVCAWLGGVELGPGEPPVYTLDNWTGNKTTLRGFTLRNGSGRCGAGAIGGTLESCLIVGNEVDPYPMASASPSGYGGGAYNSVLYNCTVTGNSSMPEFDEYGCKWGGLGGGTWGCSLYGCIEWGNFDDPEDSESYHYSIGSASLYDEFCCLEDPLFVDAVNGDYRLLSGSPCVVNGIVTAGCETEVVSGIMPELTSEQVAAWVSEDLATRYAKSGESVTDYQNRFKAKFGTDYAAAMARQTDKKDTLGNPMYVWQDYVAGTDPTDTNSVFTAQIEMVDGVPQISWSPELPSEQAALRTYTIYGKTNLTDRAWHSPTNSASRFFRVGVKLR